MNYQLAYRIGFHPWEDAEGHGPFAQKFAELLGEEEHGRNAPYGAALDLGTGSGIWAIQLAKRGWQVTGVDLVDKALQRARERVDAEGVEVELVRADVTAIRESGVGSNFRLLLGTGTFHGLKDHERVAMAGRWTQSLHPTQRFSCLPGRGVEGLSSGAWIQARSRKRSLAGL